MTGLGRRSSLFSDPRHGVAVVSVGVALAAAWWLETHLSGAPVSLLLCAVMLSAWFGGFLPGLVASILAVLGFKYYIVPPIRSLAVNSGDVARLFLFAASAFLVGSVSAAQRRTAALLRLARDHLQELLDELTKSEARLRMNIDAIPALVWCALPDGSAEFFNRRWLDYAGLTAKQAKGWGWQATIHPEDLEKLMDRWRAALAAGKPRECEARLRRFDGEYRWF